MSSEIILPCPFCGTKAAETVSCLTGFVTICADCCGPHSIEIYGETAEGSVRNWNTRAAVRPSIKPLEWTERNKKGMKFCHTAVGFYEIGVDGFLYSPWVCKYPDYQTALTAITIDYEHKVSSLLSSTPQPAIDAKALAGLLDQSAFEEVVFESMNDIWSDWVGDTGCFPCDFEWKGGKGTLSFHPSKWAARVSEQVLLKIKAALDAAGVKS